MEDCLSHMQLRSLMISELTLGREMARQLKVNLKTSSKSMVLCDFLLHKITNTFDTVLSMLKPHDDGLRSGEVSIPPLTTTTAEAIGTRLESSISPDESLGSQDSETEFRDPDRNMFDDPSRTRKTKSRWIEQVKVHTEIASEDSLCDGHTWRKYGQKDISGTIHPRGYYRCRNRATQGCLATKQVQRSDEDPTVIEVTYLGRHTCGPRTILNSASAPNVTNNARINITNMPQPDQFPLLDEMLHQQLNHDHLSFNLVPPPSDNNVPAVANGTIDENADFSRMLSNFPPYYPDNLNTHMSNQGTMDTSSGSTSAANPINSDYEDPYNKFTPNFAGGNFGYFP